MIRIIIEQVLGDFGTRLLTFYEVNSLYINLFIILYGAVIVLSWTNLKQIHRDLVLSILSQLEPLGEAAFKMTPIEALNRITLSWEVVLGNARFPFVAYQMSLLPRPKTIEAVKKLLPVEDLVREAQGILKRRFSKSKR